MLTGSLTEKKISGNMSDNEDKTHATTRARGQRRRKGMTGKKAVTRNGIEVQNDSPDVCPPKSEMGNDESTKREMVDLQGDNRKEGEAEIFDYKEEVKDNVETAETRAQEDGRNSDDGNNEIIITVNDADKKAPKDSEEEVDERNNSTKRDEINTTTASEEDRSARQNMDGSHGDITKTRKQLLRRFSDVSLKEADKCVMQNEKEATKMGNNFDVTETLKTNNNVRTTEEQKGDKDMNVFDGIKQNDTFNAPKGMGDVSSKTDTEGTHENENADVTKGTKATDDVGERYETTGNDHVDRVTVVKVSCSAKLADGMKQFDTVLNPEEKNKTHITAVADDVKTTYVMKEERVKTVRQTTTASDILTFLSNGAQSRKMSNAIHTSWAQKSRFQAGHQTDKTNEEKEDCSDKQADDEELPEGPDCSSVTTQKQDELKAKTGNGDQPHLRGSVTGRQVQGDVSEEDGVIQKDGVSVQSGVTVRGVGIVHGETKVQSKAPEHSEVIAHSEANVKSYSARQMGTNTAQSQDVQTATKKGPSMGSSVHGKISVIKVIPNRSPVSRQTPVPRIIIPKGDRECQNPRAIFLRPLDVHRNNGAILGLASTTSKPTTTGTQRDSQFDQEWKTYQRSKNMAYIDALGSSRSSALCSSTACEKGSPFHEVLAFPNRKEKFDNDKRSIHSSGNGALGNLKDESHVTGGLSANIPLESNLSLGDLQMSSHGLTMNKRCAENLSNKEKKGLSENVNRKHGIPPSCLAAAPHTRKVISLKVETLQQQHEMSKTCGSLSPLLRLIQRETTTCYADRATMGSSNMSTSQSSQNMAPSTQISQPVKPIYLSEEKPLDLEVSMLRTDCLPSILNADDIQRHLQETISMTSFRPLADASLTVTSDRTDSACEEDLPTSIKANHEERPDWEVMRLNEEAAAAFSRVYTQRRKMENDSFIHGCYIMYTAGILLRQWEKYITSSFEDLCRQESERLSHHYVQEAMEMLEDKGRYVWQLIEELGPTELIF